jgi:hypothetical protein
MVGYEVKWFDPDMKGYGASIRIKNVKRINGKSTAE